MSTEDAKRLESQGDAHPPEIGVALPDTNQISDTNGHTILHRMMETTDETEIFEQTYGHKLTSKLDGHIRLATLNVRHFPMEHRDPVKYDGLRSLSIGSEADLVGWSELGKNWVHMKEEHQLKNTTKRWWHSCSTNCASLFDADYKQTNSRNYRINL